MAEIYGFPPNSKTRLVPESIEPEKTKESSFVTIDVNFGAWGGAVSIMTLAKEAVVVFPAWSVANRATDAGP